jgi:hypothetical protein
VDLTLYVHYIVILIQSMVFVIYIVRTNWPEAIEKTNNSLLIS